MTTPAGNGNGSHALVRSLVRILLGVVGTLLAAWGAYVSTELRALQAEVTRAAEVANGAHRRVDGVAVVLSRLCGPLPTPGEGGVP